MSTASPSVALPQPLVWLAYLAILFGVLTPCDVFLPGTSQSVTATSVNPVISFANANDFGQEPITWEIRVSSGHRLQMEHAETEPIKEGGSLTLLTSAIFRKAREFQIGEETVKSSWSLYSGLWFVPMLLLVFAALTLWRRREIQKAILWLVLFLFTSILTIVLVAYPAG